jgi:hypothetical protein
MNHQRIITHLSVDGDVFKHLFKNLSHDLFHIRQINDLQFAFLTHLVAPVSLSYSGWE